MSGVLELQNYIVLTGRRLFPMEEFDMGSIMDRHRNNSRKT
jgi:hypothetical protein